MSLLTKISIFSNTKNKTTNEDSIRWNESMLRFVPTEKTNDFERILVAAKHFIRFLSLTHTSDHSFASDCLEYERHSFVCIRKFCCSSVSLDVRRTLATEPVGHSSSSAADVSLSFCLRIPNTFVHFCFHRIVLVLFFSRSFFFIKDRLFSRIIKSMWSQIKEADTKFDGKYIELK